MSILLEGKCHTGEDFGSENKIGLWASILSLCFTSPGPKIQNYRIMLRHAGSTAAPHHLWGWWFILYRACLEDFSGQTEAEARQDVFTVGSFAGCKFGEENQAIFCPWKPLLTASKQEILLKHIHILRQFLNSVLLIFIWIRAFSLIWEENKYLKRDNNILESRGKSKRLGLLLWGGFRLKNLYANKPSVQICMLSALPFIQIKFLDI